MTETNKSIEKFIICPMETQLVGKEQNFSATSHAWHQIQSRILMSMIWLNCSQRIPAIFESRLYSVRPTWECFLKSKSILLGRNILNEYPLTAFISKAQMAWELVAIRRCYPLLTKPRLSAHFTGDSRLPWTLLRLINKQIEGWANGHNKYMIFGYLCRERWIIWILLDPIR